MPLRVFEVGIFASRHFQRAVPPSEVQIYGYQTGGPYSWVFHLLGLQDRIFSVADLNVLHTIFSSYPVSTKLLGYFDIFKRGEQELVTLYRLKMRAEVLRRSSILAIEDTTQDIRASVLSMRTGTYSKI